MRHIKKHHLCLDGPSNFSVVSFPFGPLPRAGAMPLKFRGHVDLSWFKTCLSNVLRPLYQHVKPEARAAILVAG